MFKILSEEQKLIISDQCRQIKKIVEVEENTVEANIKSKREKFELEQRTCSSCNSTKNVNKIAQEIKTGTNYSRFVFIEPTEYSYSVQKNISHCSNCGNEWEKRDWYDSLFKDDETYYEKFCGYINNRLEYDATFEVKINLKYEKFYAESMREFFGNDISLRTYRKIFKSIFDKKT